MGNDYNVIAVSVIMFPPSSAPLGPQRIPSSVRLTFTFTCSYLNGWVQFGQMKISPPVRFAALSVGVSPRASGSGSGSRSAKASIARWYIRQVTYWLQVAMFTSVDVLWVAINLLDAPFWAGFSPSWSNELCGAQWTAQPEIPSLWDHTFRHLRPLRLVRFSR